jgi:hypothetical protein
MPPRKSSLPQGATRVSSAPLQSRLFSARYYLVGSRAFACLMPYRTTVRWRCRWATTRGTWRGPRRRHDGGLSAPSRQVSHHYSRAEDERRRCETNSETSWSGLAVHTGARIGALARPGEVLTSRTVRDLSAGSGLRFESFGSQRLKGLPEDTEIFRVSASTSGLTP